MTHATHLHANDTIPQEETPFDILVDDTLYNIHSNERTTIIGRWVTENNLNPGPFDDLLSNEHTRTYVSPTGKTAYFIFAEMPTQNSTVQELQEAGVLDAINHTVSQIAQHSTTQPTSEDMEEYRLA